MVMLVTLEEVRVHSRVTHSVDDDELVAEIVDASAAVLRYIGTYDFIDSAGEVDRAAMPAQVRRATLKLVESFYSQRGGGGEDWGTAEWPSNYLPPAVVALLYPLRMPSAC